jgi:hypothetical protein
MPLGPGRAGRGVIGAPVAHTAAVAGTATVAVHGHRRRDDRRDDRSDDRGRDGDHGREGGIR